MKPLLLLVALLVAATVGGKESPATSDDKVVVLEPLRIKGSPIISYSIDIRVYQEPSSKKVDRIFIVKVWPNTDAAAAGLQPGDEILKLNGVAAKEFDAVVSVESALGKIFLNRRPGEALSLEVVTRKTEKVTLRAQQPTLGDRLR